MWWNVKRSSKEEDSVGGPDEPCHWTKFPVEKSPDQMISAGLMDGVRMITDTIKPNF
jgi:hypothetical protein